LVKLVLEAYCALMEKPELIAEWSLKGCNELIFQS